MEKEVIETRTGRTWMREDGIAQHTVFAGSDQTLADAKEIVASGQKICAGNRLPLLIDGRGLAFANREARDYLAGEEGNKWIAALAILLTPLNRALGVFFLHLSEPPYPARLFTSEDKAVEWLKGFLE